MNNYKKLKHLFIGGKMEDMDIFQEEQLQSPGRVAFQNFKANKLAMTGLVTLILIFSVCFILPIFYPLDVNFQDPTQNNIGPGSGMMNVPDALQGNAKKISQGSAWGVGIDQEGAVYMWGNLTPELKQLPSNMGNIVDIAAGFDHVIAVNDQGEVFSWGSSRFNLQKFPSEVTDGEKIVKVAAGYQISFAINELGELFTWGNENLISVYVPRDEQGNYDFVVSNTTMAFALTKDHKVVPLGLIDTQYSEVPEAIQGNVQDIAMTNKNIGYVTRDGEVVILGSSDDGILGVPQELQGNAISIEGGRSHFTALDSDGNTYSWGSNSHGQINEPSKTSGYQEIYSDYYQNYGINEEGEVVTWGKKGYLMGTDQFGRDVATRLIKGGQITMTIGVIAVIVQAVIGVSIGSIAGYYGGWIDNLLMRTAEIVYSLPFIPIALIMSALIGSRLSEAQRTAMIMLILGLLSWPSLARLVRGQILAEKEKEFVTAAKAIGIKESTIIFKHIIPNIITIILVNITLGFAACLLTESTLSFLGFGVIEPNPTWGNMLTSAQSSKVIGEYWWRWVFPAIALSLSTISINMIGDGIRAAIDPKSNER